MSALLAMCYVCIGLVFVATRTRYALKHGRVNTGVSSSTNERYALYYGLIWGVAWPLLLLVSLVFAARYLQNGGVLK